MCIDSKNTPPPPSDGKQPNQLCSDAPANVSASSSQTKQIRVLLSVQLGRITVTANALSLIPMADIQRAIARHRIGDWGELDDDNRQANENALRNGNRLLSAYSSSTGVRFWLITEADRSSTTVLMPEDY